MKLLALDTANWPLGVAIMEEDRLLGEVNTQLSRNHSLRLMPAVEWLCEQAQIAPKELDGIAIAEGPGSYTGVRIGVTTAKVMAWTLNIPLIGISSLHIVAQNRYDFSGLIIPIIDARRGQVYAGKYKREDQQRVILPQAEDRLILVEHLCQELLEEKEELLFIGEGVQAHRSQITSILGDKAQFAREIEHPPRAGQLGYLAYHLWEQRLETLEDIHSFSPEYLQLAEAEANWLKKQASNEANEENAANAANNAGKEE